MAMKGKPGGPDVKLRGPNSAKMGGASTGAGNLSNYKEMPVATPKGSGKPGGSGVTPSRSRKGKATPYQGSPAPRGGDVAGSRNT